MYVPAEVDADVPEQRVVETAARAGSRGALTGWAALRWLGARWFDGRDRPVAVVGATVRAHAGLEVSYERLPEADVLTVDGLRVTTAARSASYEMRAAADLRSAVVVADMAAEADLVDLGELTAHLNGLAGWRGVEQARSAVNLAHENSWSPRETWLRLVWRLDAGLALPLCNVPVFDRAGRHVATPDLLDPVAGLVGEYDGRHHLAHGQRRKDLRRESALRELGLEYVTVIAGDSPATAAARIRAAFDRARFEQPGSRAWTTELPHGWRETRTVAQRRAGSRRPAPQRDA